MVLVVDLPIQLGSVQEQVAATGNGAHVGKQVGQLRGIGRRTECVGAVATLSRRGESRSQFAGLLIHRIGSRCGGEAGHVSQAGRGRVDIAIGTSWQSGIRDSKEGTGSVGFSRSGEIAVERVVAVEPEELVLLQRAAHVEAPLLAPVLGLVGRGDKAGGQCAAVGIDRGRVVGIVVERTPRTVVAVGEVEDAMQGVGAALGDGVDDAAGGAPELRRINAGVDLELLDHVLRG